MLIRKSAYSAEPLALVAPALARTPTHARTPMALALFHHGTAALDAL